MADESKFEFKGVDEAMQALLKQGDRIEYAVAAAANLIGADLENQMKRKIVGRHLPGTKTPSQPGSPPTSITTNLRTSITHEVERVGFGTYIVKVGPTKIYARAVELGSPRWKPNVRYPFVQPTYTEAVASGRISQIYLKVLSKAVY